LFFNFLPVFWSSHRGHFPEKGDFPFFARVFVPIFVLLIFQNPPTSEPNSLDAICQLQPIPLSPHVFILPLPLSSRNPLGLFYGRPFIVLRALLFSRGGIPLAQHLLSPRPSLFNVFPPPPLLLPIHFRFRPDPTPLSPSAPSPDPSKCFAPKMTPKSPPPHSRFLGLAPPFNFPDVLLPLFFFPRPPLCLFSDFPPTLVGPVPNTGHSFLYLFSPF